LRRTIILDNPRRTDIERKPSSRQVQAHSAMRPERDLARYDAEQAAHGAYVAGQRSQHAAKAKAGIEAVHLMVPQVRSMMMRTAPHRHKVTVRSMIYDVDPIWQASPGDWYNTELIVDYLIALAGNDASTASSLRPHVLGLFRDTEEYAPVYQRYPSVRGTPRENPKERFRSRRASKRAARGAALTQTELDTHYEQVSHDIAEARAEKMRDDAYRRQAAEMSDDYERVLARRDY